MSDEEIIQRFRKGESWAIHQYFYEYLWIGYCAFDQRYQLSKKDNLDFMSLAHQYAIYLIEHDWKPLEKRSPEVSLRTWLIGGFRFIILDALKWYKKEYGSITFEDYLRTFDISDNLRFRFNRMVEDVCENLLTDQRDRIVDVPRLLRLEQRQSVRRAVREIPLFQHVQHARRCLRDGYGKRLLRHRQQHNADGCDCAAAPLPA